jgi:asparagine synthase (glutamine-hydrolysing)
MSLDLRMGLSDDLLLYTDKITMAHSLECRVPLLDLELIRYIESLPCDSRVNVFGGKRILKKYAANILPASITNRKKKGFNSPTNIWLKKRDLLVSQLCESGGEFNTCFSADAINKIIDEYLVGLRPDNQVFLLLILRYWFDKYLS